MTDIAIRPERVRVETRSATGENRVPGMVERVVYRGSNNQVFIRLASGDLIQALVQNVGDEARYGSGDPVGVYLPPEALRILSDTGSAPRSQDADQPIGQEAETAVG